MLVTPKPRSRIAAVPSGAPSRSLHRLASRATLAACATLAAALSAGIAHSQDTDRREALEPRADTSATPAPPAAAAAAPNPAAGTTTVGVAQAAGHKAAAVGKPDVAAQHKPGADHVDLDTTTVTGNQELPRVMYIVPWKKSDIGDLAGRPPGSLLDEVLAPVDRDVFRREVRYYDAVRSQAPGDTVPAGAPARQVEK
jgi:hypothetical protein